MAYYILKCKLNYIRLQRLLLYFRFKVIKHTGGQMESLHRRLVEYAWRVEHRGMEFHSLIAEINRQFPQT